MVQYLDILQRRFLHEEVAASVQNRAEYREDLKVIENKEVTAHEREQAEHRVKQEVLRHGAWIGHGDLLTYKMFYVAKSLRQHSVTAFERLDFLEIFRLQLFHMKMAKVFQDFKSCLKRETNLEDEGSLAWISNILGMDWVSNNAQKIKVGFGNYH